MGKAHMLMMPSFICHIVTFKTTTLLATLLVLLQSLSWVGVQKVGFIMFQPLMEKLLNIEKKFTQNS